MIEVSSHSAQASPLPQLTVFVVDDDAAVLGSLRFLLEADGFAVRAFRSGTALLNASGTPGADCYVIDYKMPDINGIELAGQLRKADRDAPVILITGYPDENISTRAATAGIKHVILKPLLEENLVKCIRHAVQDRQDRLRA
jgi:FixJ family two-component response regulator